MGFVSSASNAPFGSIHSLLFCTSEYASLQHSPCGLVPWHEVDKLVMLPEISYLSPSSLLEYLHMYQTLEQL